MQNKVKKLEMNVDIAVFLWKALSSEIIFLSLMGVGFLFTF